MATKMAADFLENDSIHQISNHNMILHSFCTQNNYIRREEIQTKGFRHVILSWLNMKIFRGLNTTQHLSNYD